MYQYLNDHKIILYHNICQNIVWIVDKTTFETFDKKINKEVDKLFIYDTGNNLKNFSSNIEN